MKLSLVKIGGNLIEDPESFNTALDNFSKIEGHKVLIHGGGRRASAVSSKLGIETKMVDGRRITDAKTLEVITMVYGGLVNKNIVAKLQAMGCNALGLSGADVDAVRAVKRPVGEHDFGYVGDVVGVGGKNIHALLQANITPVFCALSHDGKGQILNTNADTIASEIAIALCEYYDVDMYYCFEKSGVLSDASDDNSVIENIDTNKFRELVDKGIVSDGMLPKLQNCFHALNNKVKQVFVGDINMLGNSSKVRTCVRL